MFSIAIEYGTTTVRIQLRGTAKAHAIALLVGNVLDALDVSRPVEVGLGSVLSGKSAYIYMFLSSCSHNDPETKATCHVRAR
jgi:hypothetical protein